MANITLITDGLWTGGDLPQDEATAELHIRDWTQAGITHVVDNRLEWSDKALVAHTAPRISYLHNGADDAGQQMPDVWFNNAVTFASAAWEAEPGAGVLLHCHMGINRGPSAAFAVLLTRGWDPIEAIDLIRAQRPIARVDYAEDALNWWHRRAGADPDQRSNERVALAAWRRLNPHETVRIIRAIRAGQTAA